MEGLADFLESKQACFQSTVKSSPAIWGAFELLDRVWSRALDDLKVPGEERFVPLLLFFSAHSKIRIATELAFARCLPEAWSVARNAIESVAFAIKILREPRLASLWLGSTTTEAWLKNSKKPGSRKAFDQEFTAGRKKNLFSPRYGLTNLYRYWSRYSELGSHPTFSSQATHLFRTSSATALHHEFRYLDMEKEWFIVAVVDILNCCRIMENLLYKGFEERLQLDVTLGQMREQLSSRVRELNQSMMAPP